MTIIPPREEVVIETTTPARAVPTPRLHRRVLRALNEVRTLATLALTIAIIALVIAVYGSFIQNDATGGIDLHQVDQEICVKQLQGLSNLHLITFNTNETAASVCASNK